MTTAYTPTAQIATSNPATHADGDDGNATNFNRPLEPLLDARAFVRSLAPGMLLWRGLFAVDTGGSNSSFTVRFSPIEAVVLPDGSGTLYVFEGTAAETTIGASKIDGGGNLSNSTWYYVYAYRNAGSLDYLISTTAPDVYLTFRNGAQTHRYLGCFRTDGSGAPYAMRGHRGRYTYQNSATSDTVVYTTGGAAAYGSLSLASFVPPHSRLARLRLELANTSASALASLAVRTPGDTTSSYIVYAPKEIGGGTSADYGRGALSVEVITNSNQAIERAVVGAGAAPAITVAGFSE